MEQAALAAIFLTRSKIKLQKQETCQIRTRFTKEPSCVKTKKFMLTDMKMIMPTSTVCRPKPGLKSELL